MVAVQLLEQNRALDLNSLKEMAEQVEGSFAFTVMDVQNNLYFVKGRQSPLHLPLPQNRAVPLRFNR